MCCGEGVEVMPTTTDDAKELLVSFPRRNRENNTEEAIRIETGDFNGRQLTHVRLWYKSRPNGRGDDGWRPSKAGFTIREHELDQAIEALEASRRIVHEAGRSTSSEPNRSSSSARRPAIGNGPVGQPHFQRQDHHQTMPSRSTAPVVQPEEDDAPF